MNVIEREVEEKRKNKEGKEGEETEIDESERRESRGIKTGNQNQKQNFEPRKK